MKPVEEAFRKLVVAVLDEVITFTGEANQKLDTALVDAANWCQRTSNRIKAEMNADDPVS